MMDALYVLFDLTALLFASSAMISVGLGAGPEQTRPLRRHAGFLLVAVVASVVVLPGAALLISYLLPVDVSLAEGLLLAAIAAGSWTLPPLARSAGLESGFESGVRLLLVLTSVLVAPIAVPWVLGDGPPGFRRIAAGTGLFVLLPVLGGMALRRRNEAVTDRAREAAQRLSTSSLIVLVALFFALNLSELGGLVASGALLIALMLAGIAVGVGYLVGGLAPAAPGTHAVGMAQRNLPVAVVIATVGFNGNGIVMAMVLSYAAMALMVTTPIAIRISRRNSSGEASADTSRSEWRLLRRWYRRALSVGALGLAGLVVLAVAPRSGGAAVDAADATRSEYPVRVLDVSRIEDSVSIEIDVPIVTRDGTRLSANVYRPKQAGKYPVVMAFTAYGKDRGPDGYPAYLSTYPSTEYDFGTIPVSPWTTWEGPDPAFWVPEGYAVVYVDSRGYFSSEGAASVLSEQDGEDFYDAIEWAASQAWSNGNVGLNGVSYLAIAQWAAASTSPPHLKAIIPWEGQTDAFREVLYHGGIPETAFTEFWLNRLRSAANEAPVPPQRIFEFAHERPRLLRLVQEAPAFDLGTISVPALISASWSDHGLHSRGSFEAFKQISSEQKWLFTHGRSKWDTYYSEEALQIQLLFLDHFLKGADNGMDDVPSVRLEVREDIDDYQVRYEDAWPVPGTEYRSLYLDAATGSLLEEPTATVTTFDYEPFVERATFTFTFAEDTELTGNMSLRLWVSTDRGSDMDLFVGVEKLDAGGQVVTFYGKAGYTLTPAAMGWLRVSERAIDPERSTPWQPVLSHERSDTIARNEIVPVDIEILPSSTLFRAGETLRLVVQGEDLIEHRALAHTSSVNRGTHTIYSGGEYASQLLIPVIP